MSIVLIAEPDHLEALQARAEYQGALAFTDAETPAALEAIITNRPDIVAIERVFAKKSRGAALINRIKADTSLDVCEIRIVAHDGGAAKVAGHGGSAAASGPAASPGPTMPPAGSALGTSLGTSTAVAAVAVAVAAPPAALDQKGTRRAQRYKIIEGIEVLIDGNPAMLVDLSTVGAQVVSGTLLKPNQRVRLSFVEGVKPVRFSAGVAWSAFELPKGEPRYRAGIEFFDADPEAVGRFCETNRADVIKPPS